MSYTPVLTLGARRMTKHPAASASCGVVNSFDTGKTPRLEIHLADVRLAPGFLGWFCGSLDDTGAQVVVQAIIYCTQCAIRQGGAIHSMTS